MFKIASSLTSSGLYCEKVATHQPQKSASTDMEPAANNRRSFYSYGYSSSSDDEDKDHGKESHIPQRWDSHDTTKADDAINTSQRDAAYVMNATPTTASTYGTSSLVAVATVLEEDQQYNMNSQNTDSVIESLPSPIPPPNSLQTKNGTSSGEPFTSDGETSNWNIQFGFQNVKVPTSQPSKNVSRPKAVCCWNQIDQDRGRHYRNNYKDRTFSISSREGPGNNEKNRQCCRRPEWCRRRYYRRSCQLYNGTTCCPSWLICAMFTIFVLGFVLGSIVVSNIWNVSAFGSRVEQPPLPPSNITVGAYYYPWHKDDFHRGQGYLREKLMPPQQPTLGEYDDTDSKVISQHLAWSRQANIRLWVASWWGPGSREDETLLNHILTHPDLTADNVEGQDEPSKHFLALFYETRGRIKESEGYSIHRVASDIAYICDAGYLDHDNYFRIDGRPALFVYLTRALESAGLLAEVVKTMRQTARACGHDIYLVGDHAFREAPTLSNDDSENRNIFGNKQTDKDYFPHDDLMDAVTNYDVYGSVDSDGYHAGKAKIDVYYEMQAEWRDWTRHHCPTCGFIPAVSPGYNDLGVRPEKQHPPLSRRLEVGSPEGSLFEAALEKAVDLVDEQVQNLLMVNSFNEWHEDTQIEPVRSSGLGSTTVPNQFTHGLEYEGYGDLYLNLLREATIDQEQSA